MANLSFHEKVKGQYVKQNSGIYFYFLLIFISFLKDPIYSVYITTYSISTIASTRTKFR
jgi:hypothetical protein